jgi:spermidine/putrescine transport system substrate-binding protein
MNKNEILDKYRSGTMTRREFKKALAAFGIGVVSVPLVQKAVRAAELPMLLGWGGYDEPGFHQQFAEKFGSPPLFSPFGDEEEAFAKIRAGFQPDATMICSYKVPHWAAAGVIQPIDTSRLPNFADSIESLTNVPGTIINGERFWVCQDWGQTSILYRHDLVDLEEESWGLMWDERYSGRIAMIDSLIDGVMVAAIYGGAADPFDMTAEEVQMTRDLLREQLPLLRYYTNSMTDIENSLASGELVAAVAWNEAYAVLLGEDVPVSWMQPKEGAMTWTCGLVLMSGAEDVDGAYEIIDSMLSPSAGVYEMSEWGYGHANKKAFEMIDSKVLLGVGLPEDPDTLLNSGIFQKPIQNEPELQSMFEEVKAGF